MLSQFLWYGYTHETDNSGSWNRQTVLSCVFRIEFHKIIFSRNGNHHYEKMQKIYFSFKERITHMLEVEKRMKRSGTRLHCSENMWVDYASHLMYGIFWKLSVPAFKSKNNAATWRCFKMILLRVSSIHLSVNFLNVESVDQRRAFSLSEKHTHTKKEACRQIPRSSSSLFLSLCCCLISSFLFSSSNLSFTGS